MNPFQTFAEETKPAWQARKERISEARLDRAAKEKREEKEQSELSRIYRAWRRGRIEQLDAGPYGKEIKALRSLMRTMTLSSAPALLTFIERAEWARKADADTRHEVLDLVSRGITALRLRNGLTPFEDALPGEEPNAFLVIREMLS